MTTKKQKPASGDLVEIEWGDAHGNAGWQKLEDLQHFSITCWTIGWFIRHDDEGISVAASCNTELDFSNSSFVPGGMIKKVTVLKKARKKR